MIKGATTWRHLNGQVRIKGLTSTQLGLGVLLPLAVFGLYVWLAPVVIVVEFILWRWYYRLQMKGKKDRGEVDYFPFKTMQVKDGSPSLIQDNSDFYERLINPKDD